MACSGSFAFLATAQNVLSLLCIGAHEELKDVDGDRIFRLGMVRLQQPNAPTAAPLRKRHRSENGGRW